MSLLPPNSLYLTVKSRNCMQHLPEYPHTHTRTHIRKHTHVPWPCQRVTTLWSHLKQAIFVHEKGILLKFPQPSTLWSESLNMSRSTFAFLFSSDDFSVCKLPQINMTFVNININAVLAPRYCYSYSVWSVYCIYKYIYMALSAFCCALRAPQWSATILYKWCLCAHMLRPR